MMPELKKILFTTDLSKGSRHTFEYAVSLASRYDASITILHVMEEISPSSKVHLIDFLGDERWQELKESHEQETRQILIGKKREGAMIREALAEICEDTQKKLADTHFTTDEIVVARGNVVDEILNEARARGCDLIVMGYHVRGKLEEAILGSTPRRLLRRIKIPVMLIPIFEDG